MLAPPAVAVEVNRKPGVQPDRARRRRPDEAADEEQRAERLGEITETP